MPVSFAQNAQLIACNAQVKSLVPYATLGTIPTTAYVLKNAMLCNITAMGHAVHAIKRNAKNAK